MLLFALLIFFSDIPDSLYSSYCTKEVVDSIYTDCRCQASEYYPTDSDAGAKYLLADWAYGVSLLDLSQMLLEDVLETEASDEILRADCLSLSSAVARLQGNLSLAISYAESCLALDRESGNQENISSSLNNIAGLYMTYGDAVSARKYIDEALEIERKLKRSAYLAVRCGVASEIYLKMGEVDEALAFADEALHLDSLDNRVGKVAVRRSQKGAVLMEMQRYDDANLELDLAIPVFRSYNNLNSLAIALAQSGEIAFRLGDYLKSMDLLTECVEVCGETGNIYIESRVRKDLWQLQRKDNPSSAIVHLERYVELQNRLNSDKTTRMMQDFNVRYESLKKEQTIRLQRNRLLWSGVAVILLVVIVIVVVILAVMRNRAAKAMEARNAVLVKAGQDKDRLLAIAKSKIPYEVSQQIISIVSDSSIPFEIVLTKREMEVAELCAQGLISKEIASKLKISQRTVETHKNNIFKKLGINNTVELARYVHEFLD